MADAGDLANFVKQQRHENQPNTVGKENILQAHRLAQNLMALGN